MISSFGAGCIELHMENISCFLTWTKTAIHICETCKTKKPLAVGIIADIKVGHRNSLEVLKFDGKEREIEYDKLEDEEYQTVPKYLLPVRSAWIF